MNKKILVPLGQYDRIEDMIPYIENIVRPEMRVVFLVRYPTGGIRWQKEEYGIKAVSEVKELARYYSWEVNLEMAKTNIAPACESLRAKGIEAAVEVYAGSLKKTLRNYTANGDVYLIMTRAGIGQRIAEFLNGSNSIVDLFKRPSASPVLLVHPGMTA